ncbi:Cytochrome b-c1 complex subunit 6, mitochondrial [Trichinella pseudospiralis]|uniref:Cytochrome b-c1 complex subunit 6, mitochondrial n=2 Tax=Trichinella pseudospiralis TaxID=6337 RepID=A0A0V1J5L4_TRIPS|nr:Cytochrome b-c1 complex subunit 6, mitochondrial [Trichinella pseudospiralis]
MQSPIRMVLPAGDATGPTAVERRGLDYREFGPRCGGQLADRRTMSDEIQDPLARLRKKCQEEKCQQFVQKLEICSNRVKSRKNTEENCHDEVIDMMRCVDHCVSSAAGLQNVEVENIMSQMKLSLKFVLLLLILLLSLGMLFCSVLRICITFVIVVLLLLCVSSIESSYPKSVHCVHDVNDSFFGFYDIHSMKCVTLTSIAETESPFSASAVLRDTCNKLWESEPADIIPMVIRQPNGGHEFLVKQFQHINLPEWFYGKTILLKYRISGMWNSSQNTFTINIYDTDNVYDQFSKLEHLELSSDELLGFNQRIIRADHVFEDFNYVLVNESSKLALLQNDTNGLENFCFGLHIEQDGIYNTIHTCNSIPPGNYAVFCYTAPVVNCEYSRGEDGKISCICNANFTGHHCDKSIFESSIDEKEAKQNFTKEIVSSATCAGRPNMCLNGGTCIMADGRLFCSCPFPYQGETCEFRDDKLLIQSDYKYFFMSLKMIVVQAVVGYLLLVTIIVLWCIQHRVRNKKRDILKKLENKRKLKEQSFTI